MDERTTREWLESGLAELRARPWLRGQYHNPKTGGVCAIGAMWVSYKHYKGAPDHANYPAALAALAHQVALLTDGDRFVEEYNDNHAHTKDDIIHLYEKAIADCP